MTRPEITGRKFIGTRAVSQRYNISTRTVDRWVKAKVLPESDLRVRERKYWDEEKLDQHDRQRVAEHGMAKTQRQAAAPEQVP